MNDHESDFEGLVQSFHAMVQEINQYYLKEELENKKNQKNSKMRRKKFSSIQFKMQSHTQENVQDIVSFNKSQVVRMFQPIQIETKKLNNWQIEPYLDNIQQLMREIKLKQQVLRNVQKQVYLNLINHYKNHKKTKIRLSCMHMYVCIKYEVDKQLNKYMHNKLSKPKIAVPTLFKSIEKSSTTS